MFLYDEYDKWWLTITNQKRVRQLLCLSLMLIRIASYRMIREPIIAMEMDMEMEMWIKDLCAFISRILSHGAILFWCHVRASLSAPAIYIPTTSNPCDLTMWNEKEKPRQMRQLSQLSDYDDKVVKEHQESSNSTSNCTSTSTSNNSKNCIVIWSWNLLN